MKVVLTAFKPQEVILVERDAYIFFEGKWICCNDILDKKENKYDKR